MLLDRLTDRDQQEKQRYQDNQHDMDPITSNLADWD